MRTHSTLHMICGTQPATDVQLLSQDAPADSEFQRFADAAKQGNLVPLYERVMSDQLTPVLAYRCLVREDDREAPSFLFESVVNGNQQVRATTGLIPTTCTCNSLQGRYSFIGAQPSLEIVATQGRVVILDHEAGTRVEREVGLRSTCWYTAQRSTACNMGHACVTPVISS